MRHAPDAVMIFAAGFGTRMKELTQDRPKPLIHVAGKPLIDHALDLVEAAGIPNRIANVHYKPDPLITHLKTRDVAISDERDVILETGGGLKKARPLLPDAPVFTMNSDAIFRGPNPFDALRATWDPDEMNALLLLVPVAQAHGTESDGDFQIDNSGRLTRGPGFIYSGVQIINPACVDDVAEDAFSLNIVWNQIAKKGRLYGIAYDGHWCDVGHPAGIKIAEDLLERTDV
ncbi:MAG: nucleotidyltransferase family protein [Pseudomonadota bacterium]